MKQIKFIKFIKYIKFKSHTRVSEITKAYNKFERLCFKLKRTGWFYTVLPNMSQILLTLDWVVAGPLPSCAFLWKYKKREGALYASVGRMELLQG